MIEAYAFLAAFAAQILVGSVLIPSSLIRYVRGWAIHYGSERFAQLYPGIDYGRWTERFAIRCRAVTIVIAVLGVFLLGWLSTLIRHPDWADDVTRLAMTYFFLQMSPLVLLCLYAFVRHYKTILQPSQEPKRKAMLQRRGLFDFVSPFVISLAVVSYIVFVVYGIWLDLHVYGNTTLSRQCLIALGTVTAVYALNAFIIYKSLYGKRNPLMSNEGRARTIGLRVKSNVYVCIASAWFISLLGTLGQPGLQEWKPFAVTLFVVISMLAGFMEMTGAPRKADPDALGVSGT